MNALIESTQELLRFAIAERDAFYDCSTDAEGNLADPGDQAELDRMDAMIDRARAALSDCANDGVPAAVNLMFSTGHKDPFNFTASDRRLCVSYPASPSDAHPEGFIFMPEALTAENGAKYLLSGEFYESVELECTACDDGDDSCEVCSGHGTFTYRVPISWSSIKEIYARATQLSVPASDHIVGARKMIPVDEDTPEMGVPVIGYHPDWADPDFNDRGLRECFRFGDGKQWHSAKWFDEQDCYITAEGAPTHWAPMVPKATPSVPENEIKAQSITWAAEYIREQNSSLIVEDLADDLDYEATRLRTAGDEGEEDPHG